MKLIITTPTEIVTDVDSVQSVRAEDSSGSFGIMAGHADFLTVLTVSVLTWRRADGIEHCAALRGGVLRVRDGEVVEVATREAVVCDQLAELRDRILAEMARSVEAERTARLETMRLQQAAIRRLYNYIRPAQRKPREQTRTFDGEPS